MNTELYNKWIMSHQVEDGSIDITDTVMSHITKKAHKPNVFMQTWENIILDLMQAKVLVRACVLGTGAILGMIRIALQIYSALFV